MKNSTAFILILISGGLFYTFIMPEYEKIQALRAEAAQYNSVLDNVADLSQTRDELLLKYNAMPKTDTDNLKRILPDNVNVVELALNLDAIAAKYGISIKNVKIVDDKSNQNATTVQTPSPGTYEKATINFVFITSYENFRNFERDLEQSLRILEVKEVKITAQPDSNFNQFDMQIETYWLK
jgi:Tfp pilus assembly protein PilO